MKFSGARLRVYFAADTVSAVWQRGFVRREVKCTAAPVMRDQTSTEAWAPALRELGKLFASQGWHGMPVDIAVSSEFIHLALVPQIKQNLSSLEMQGLAHGMFARVLGEAAAGWSIRYCSAGRTAVLAAATASPMLAELEDLARANQCSLRSVTPLWSCAVNRQRKHLARRSAWFVVAEPRAVAYGLMEMGQWRSLRARPLDPERGLGVARLIERESRYLGAETRDLVFICGAPSGEPFTNQWKIDTLPPADAALGALPDACRPAGMAGY